MPNATGTGQVMSLEMEAVHNQQDWLASHIANMYVGFVQHPEWRRWVKETRELQDFLYAIDTTQTSNDQGSEGQVNHTTHRPKLTQLYDTLEANYLHALFPHDDWLQFRALDEDSNKVEKRRKIEAFMRSRHHQYGHREMATQALRDWLAMGSCVVSTEYKSVTAQTIDGMKVKGYTGPVTERLHPYRVAFNTRATSFEESPKIIQSIKTLGDIAKMIEDERLPLEFREVLHESRMYRHYMNRNLGAFDTEWLDTPFEGYGQIRDYWCGQTVEILTFYGSIYDPDTMQLYNNKKITVIDRKWVLTEEDINTPNGNPAIFRSTWRSKPNSLIGMSPLQNIMGMQFYINHLENVRANAFDQMVTPDRVISGVDDIRKRTDGGYDYFIHEGGGVKYLNPDPTVLQADFRIEAAERKMEEYVGAPAAAAGIKVPGEQTKFQFSQLNNAAGRLFQRKIQAFEDDILIPSANAELDLARRKLDVTLPVEVVDEELGERVFENVSSTDLQSEGGLVATGARHYALQAQLVQELNQFMLAIANEEDVKLHISGKKIAELWDSLLSFGGTSGIYQPFVRIEERTDAELRLSAAQEVLSKQNQVSPDALAADQAANPTQGI